MLRRIDNYVFWSHYPSPTELEDLIRSGEKIDLIVNLVDSEYRDVKYIGVAKAYNIDVHLFPIPDYFFLPHEYVNRYLLSRVINAVERGEKILIHCLGGIGRSGTIVAMYLVRKYSLPFEEALARVRGLGGGPESNIQLNSLRWFYISSRLMEYRFQEEIYEIGEKYDFGASILHASTVANIALDIAYSMANFYGFSREDLLTLYISSLLHDIGYATHSEDKHHLGSELLVEKNWPPLPWFIL